VEISLLLSIFYIHYLCSLTILILSPTKYEQIASAFQFIKMSSNPKIAKKEGALSNCETHNHQLTSYYLGQGFLRCFRDQNRVPRIRENYDQRKSDP